MIVSTGMASVAELEETLRVGRDTRCQALVLLKCTSTYPAELTNTNVLTIPHMWDLSQRDVYVAEDIGVAEPFTEKNLQRIRPDNGLPCARCARASQ